MSMVLQVTMAVRSAGSKLIHSWHITDPAETLALATQKFRVCDSSHLSLIRCNLSLQFPSAHLDVYVYDLVQVVKAVQLSPLLLLVLRTVKI